MKSLRRISNATSLIQTLSSPYRAVFPRRTDPIQVDKTIRQLRESNDLKYGQSLLESLLKNPSYEPTVESVKLFSLVAQNGGMGSADFVELAEKCSHQNLDTKNLETKNQLYEVLPSVLDKSFFTEIRPSSLFSLGLLIQAYNVSGSGSDIEYNRIKNLVVESLNKFGTVERFPLELYLYHLLENDKLEVAFHVIKLLQSYNYNHLCSQLLFAFIVKSANNGTVCSWLMDNIILSKHYQIQLEYGLGFQMAYALVDAGNYKSIPLLKKHLYPLTREQEALFSALFVEAKAVHLSQEKKRDTGAFDEIQGHFKLRAIAESNVLKVKDFPRLRNFILKQFPLEDVGSILKICLNDDLHSKKDKTKYTDFPVLLQLLNVFMACLADKNHGNLTWKLWGVVQAYGDLKPDRDTCCYILEGLLKRDMKAEVYHFLKANPDAEISIKSFQKVVRCLLPSEYYHVCLPRIRDLYQQGYRLEEGFFELLKEKSSVYKKFS